MWSSRNKMLLDAEGDGEDDVAFLSGIKDIDLNTFIQMQKVPTSWAS